MRPKPSYKCYLYGHSRYILKFGLGSMSGYRNIGYLKCLNSKNRNTNTNLYYFSEFSGVANTSL